MEYFWHTSGTIPKGLGFTHYSSLHLAWLAVFLAVTVICSWHYRRCTQVGRGRFRRIVACLLVADELFKLIPMLILGRFKLIYLPFQLCSINLFLIAYHAWRPNKMLDNFLYAVCIPGAMAALLFPTWTKLPGLNYMCIHSFTVHILLALYPIVLTVGGDIKPRARELGKTMLLLVALAGLAALLNLWWGTNFMFLVKADKGNPLYWFQKNWGSHLYGFPVIIVGVILVMYGPIEVYHKLKHRKNHHLKIG